MANGGPGDTPSRLWEAMDKLAAKRGHKPPETILGDDPKVVRLPTAAADPPPRPRPRPRVPPVEGVKGEQPWWNKD